MLNDPELTFQELKEKYPKWHLPASAFFPPAPPKPKKEKPEVDASASGSTAPGAGTSAGNRNKKSILFWTHEDYSCVHSLVESVRNHTLFLRVEETVACIVHNLIIGSGIIKRNTSNSKCAMHNVRVTAACKRSSHVQLMVSYRLDEVNSVYDLKKPALCTWGKTGV